MSLAFIKDVKENIPKGKIIFDKFYLMKITNKAVDKVEEKKLRSKVFQNMQY